MRVDRLFADEDERRGRMMRSLITISSLVLLQSGCLFTMQDPASVDVDELVQETALDADTGPDPSQKIAVPRNDELR